MPLLCAFSSVTPPNAIGFSIQFHCTITTGPILSPHHLPSLGSPTPAGVAGARPQGSASGMYVSQPGASRDATCVATDIRSEFFICLPAARARESVVPSGPA